MTRSEEQMKRDLHAAKEHMQSKRRYFFDGWLTFVTLVILPLCALAAYWNIHTGDPLSRLPASNWWWIVGIAVLVYGARAYQFFIQKR